MDSSFQAVLEFEVDSAEARRRLRLQDRVAENVRDVYFGLKTLFPTLHGWNLKSRVMSRINEIQLKFRPCSGNGDIKTIGNPLTLKLFNS